MCYSALVKSDLKKLESQFGAEAVKELWDWVYETHKSDPKKIKLPGSDHRIFPKYIAPAMYQKDNKIVIEPMRYSVPTPSFIDPKINKYTTFNARFDNLDSRFWSEAFMVHHGFIVLNFSLLIHRKPPADL